MKSSDTWHISRHPIDFFAVQPPSPCREVATLEHRSWCDIVALVVTSRRVAATTAGGERRQMAFATWEDDTGLVETTWFPKVYRQAGMHLETGTALLVGGVVQVEFGVNALLVQRAQVVTWQPPAR